jgi:hypothetical protein
VVVDFALDVVGYSLEVLEVLEVLEEIEELEQLEDVVTGYVVGGAT